MNQFSNTIFDVLPTYLDTYLDGRLGPDLDPAGVVRAESDEGSESLARHELVPLVLGQAREEDVHDAGGGELGLVDLPGGIWRK